MAYDIGTARGVIEIDYNGKGVDAAKKDMQGLGDTSKKSAMSMDDIGRNAGRAGLVIAAGLGAGVVAAANFEQRMSAIKAVSGASGSEMDALSKKALQLGKDTQFSATESAQAMEELIKAGLSTEDVLNGAADATVNLAAAGEVDMATAATIASNAMNQFNLKAKDMNGVVDNIAGAANASAIDVTDFGNSLAQVGAVANLAGVKFDDTATAIALMGNAGIKGSDAGTSLKSMLMRLQPTTTKAFDTMQGLGLITFDTNAAMQTLADNGIKNVAKGDAREELMKLSATLSDSEVGSAKAEKKFQELGLQSGALRNQFYKTNGETKSMADIAGVLGDSLDGLNKRQKQQALQTLFGSDAIRAAAVVADAGTKGFNKMAESMGKVSAADVAKTRMDNFKGSLEAMKGSLETAGIAIGMVLLPPLRKLVEAVSSALDAFLNLSPGIQKAIVGFAAGVAGILLMVAAIIKIVQFIKAFQAALVAIRAAMAVTWVAALGPIALIIAAIAAVVAIIVLLWKKNDAFRAAVIAVWNAIKAAVAAVVAWFQSSVAPVLAAVWASIKAQLNGLKIWFGQAWSAIRQIISAAWNAIKPIVTAGMNLIMTVIRAGMAVLGPLFRGAWNVIVAIVKAVWSVLKTVVSTGVKILGSVIMAVLNVLRGNWRGAWNNIKSILQTTWNAIKSVVQTGINLVKSVIVSTVNAIKGAWNASWNAIKSVASSVWNAIKAVITGAVNAIKSVISSQINSAKAIVNAAWQAVKSGTVNAWNGIKNAVTNAISTLMGVIQSIPGKIQSAFAGAGGWLVSAGTNVVQGFINGIQSMAGAVVNALVGLLPGPLKKFAGKLGLSSPSKLFMKYGKDVVKGFTIGVDGAQETVANSMEKFADTVNDGFQKMFKKKEHADAAMRRFNKSLKDEKKAVNEAAKAYDGLVAHYNKVKEDGTAAYDAIIERLNTAKEALADLQEQQADYAASVRDAFVAFGSVVGLGIRTDVNDNPLAPSAGAIVADLEQRAQEAQRFNAVLQHLIASGINDETLRQLTAAGPEAGLATAEAIAAGGPAAINQINILSAQIAAAGAALGAATAAKFYQEGVNAAAAVVRGIASEAANAQAATQRVLNGIQREIDRSKQALAGAMFVLGEEALKGLRKGLVDEDKLKDTAEKIAKAIKNEVKKALGIKSPSKVFRELGEQTALGFKEGIEGMQRDVIQASKAMADAAATAILDPALSTTVRAIADPMLSAGPIPSVRVPAGAAASRAGSNAPTGPPSFDVRVFIGDQELTDLVRVEVGETLSPLRTLTRQGAL